MSIPFDHQVRVILAQAERELQERPTAPLLELQPWLQLTYELETRHYELKREAAERQLLIAKEMVRLVISSYIDNQLITIFILKWYNKHRIIYTTCTGVYLIFTTGRDRVGLAQSVACPPLAR